MANEDEVKNVNEPVQGEAELKERANQIMELLSKEPKMRLQPFLRFSEVHGVQADVRLTLIKDYTHDANTDTTGDSGEEVVSSETGSTDEQPATA